jgi:hypothetical protein
MTMADTRQRWKENSAKYVSTLVNLDEPQVVMLDHGDDAKIIGVAINKEGYDNPFLGAEISFTQWERYNRQFVDLHYLFLLPKWKRWYIFDLDALDENNRIPLKRAQEADYRNEKYLPAQGLFWARSHTEDDPVFEASLEVVSQKFLIDGTWDPPDISQFFARINDIYSFFLGIGKFLSEKTNLDQKRALVNAFTDNTLHSGFNYVNFYGDLKGLVTFGERLAMPAIVKQSPGFVDVEGKATTLNEVAEALANFDKKQDAIKVEYNMLRKFLSKSKLLKAGHIDKLDRNDPIFRFIREHNKTLSESLGVDVGPIEKLTGNVLTTAKILLAHYRRLERYHMFFVEGRARYKSVAASTPSTAARPGA